MKHIGITGTDTSRSRSAAVWRGLPYESIKSGAVDGWFFEDDFTSFNITPATTEGNWSAERGYAQFSSTGGTITAGTGQGGEAIFASDGDDEGASIRTLATPFQLDRGVGLFCFEARIKTSTIADTKHGFFCGLMENAALTATVPITAAGALADVNLVGFHRLEGDGDMLDTVYKANGVTAVTVGTDAITLVADTYVKVGMRLEQRLDRDGDFILSFYKDGVRLANTKQIPSADGTDFPNDVKLGLVFAVLNATATTPGNATIDRWWAAQLAW